MKQYIGIIFIYSCIIITTIVVGCCQNPVEPGRTKTKKVIKVYENDSIAWTDTIIKPACNSCHEGN